MPGNEAETHTYTCVIAAPMVAIIVACTVMSNSEAHQTGL